MYDSAPERLPELYEKRCSGAPMMMAHPPGWDELILELDERLNEIYPEYELYQSKQKFGGLRYYIGPHEPLTQDKELFNNVYGLIHEYEAMSYTICELCGAEGKLRSLGYFKTTLCDEHMEEAEKRNEEDVAQ